ncbi:hypothetical protein EVAR_3820_1 [Eumeta japonica]|uniref:Uncharacterized protein n=1 Tax=Eumeta variegata TaxID=151549 RepID=A0A4C1SUD4_EUMVA|nr:hypothetical protein EVAR_3820_1 [Eumeta japonica]
MPSRPKGDSAKGIRQGRHHNPEQWRGRRGESNPHRRNITSVVIKAGNFRIGAVSVYFEEDKPIRPYLDRVWYACSKVGTDKVIRGGDVNA